MSSTICPYPGLRPFNEEESIFFKGREQQVERLVKRLEEKKFLMVNGASGDGKSSLIYAGVIPFAKAGFFKAKYNNWIVADFRPERSPLKNLTASVCRQLKIEDQNKTEKELGYGFSALCDLYKASSYYIDESKSAWIAADEKEKKVLKRKGTNLLVLVDQFEEFFTNPENYQNGIPSIESQKTVNLLLETYKLAAAQDLPIYVVCTMRSDYIGQCAAFRGLPEAIGYSQFFVPRLKRQEIEQVIEGPAELAGCKISKRLTQTLLNSLTDGFDQLPILQHALHQIWKAADKGNEEMDLIHLAKVGGISSKHLNIDDKATFETWAKSLPDYKIQLYEKPSLSNILNAHANELYLTAHIIYEQQFAKQISEEQSKKIIKCVFQCLTKIDASRAVRNRMTLQEITNIINDEKINVEKVDHLLQIYRQQGNTFLQPFIGEQGENKELNPDSVLDITHESLIRNWLQLTEWANEEYENLQNYLDFNKQLQRWIASDYNSGYLLPIGPLSFFENWVKKLNPSKYWINRYEEFDGDEEQKLAQAEERVIQAHQFIQKSARRLIFSRTVLRYGAQRIAIAAGIMLLMGLCTYYYFDYRKKQNDYVLVELIARGKEMLKSPQINVAAKASFIINNYRLNELNGQVQKFETLMNTFDSDTLKLDVSLEIIKKCATYSVTATDYFSFANDSLIYDKKLNISLEALRKCTELLPLLKNKTSKGIDSLRFESNNLERINKILCSAALLKDHLSHSTEIDSLCETLVNETKFFLHKCLLSNNIDSFSISRDDFFYTMMNILAIDQKPDYRSILVLLSPYENKLKSGGIVNALDTNINPIQLNNETIYKHGLFELLAILYATEYEQSVTSKFYLKCLIDSSVKYNYNYNPQNITDVLLKFSKNPIENIEQIIGLTNQNLWVDKLGYWANNCKYLFNEIGNGDDYLKNETRKIIHFIPDDAAEAIWTKYLNAIYQIPNINYIVQFQLAQYYKLKGFFDEFKYKNKQKVDKNFELALQNFEAIPNEIRENEYSESKQTNNTSSISENFMQIFPTIEVEFYKGTGSFSSTGFTLIKNKQKSLTIFYDFIIEKERFSLFYSAYGQYALAKSSLVRNKKGNGHYFKIITDYLLYYKKINKNDKSLYSVIYFNNLMSITNPGLFEKQAVKFIKNCVQENISYTYFMPELILKAAKMGNENLVLTLLNMIGKKERINQLTALINNILKGDGIEYTFMYFNQLYKYKNNEPDMLPSLYRILGKIGGNAIEKLGKEQYRNIPEMIKPFVLTNWILGTAENGNYYKASRMISDNYSEFQELNLINLIVYCELINKQHKGNDNMYFGNWNDSQFYNNQVGDEEYNIFGF